MGSLSLWTQAKLACSICNGFAIITTILRLYFRITRNRLWVDDYLAIVSALASVVQLSVIFADPHRADFGVLRFYLSGILFYTVLWSARLSTMFCTIRIVRAALQRIDHLLWLAALFVLFWVFLVVQMFWECEARESWLRHPVPICDFNDAIPSCRFVTDLIGDAILLLVSTRVFTIIQQRKLRTRLVLIFGTSVITTLGSIPLLVLVLNRRAPILEFVAALVENSVSLVVCNFPVLFTAVVKLQDQVDLPLSPDDINLQTSVVPQGHALVVASDSDRHLGNTGPGVLLESIV